MISVQTADFDVAGEYAALTAGDVDAGAVVLFVGRVRELNLARQVTGLLLEHYPGMTEKALEEILAEARSRWQLIRCRIIHRIGRLTLGDQIVLVGVTSPHREQAFAAAEFLMDYLKTRAPFWKKEMTSDGEFWVDAQEKDEVSAQRWKDQA
ncbi:MAG: molybdopterin synthase catalytic subunit MoaE [Cellvibrio sp.]|jgi:Molybdopterin converting factor, large subunit